MQITTTYNVGDAVFTVAKRPVVTPVTCAACGSTGYVTLTDGVKYVCPRCKAQTTTPNVEEQYVVAGTVKRILPAACPRGCRVKYEIERPPAKTAILMEMNVYATEAGAQAAITP